MCGVVGYFGTFEAHRLGAANGLQSHRGPDDSGQFVDRDAGVGLGHVRLSILDLSPLGHQPMVSPDGTVVIVYNGEIYNFGELKAELEGNGHQFLSHSDTEVLLRLYLTQGEKMLGRLN